MEEKVLIQSKKINVKKLFLFFIIIGAFLTVLNSVLLVSSEMSYYNKEYGENHKHDLWCYSVRDDFYDDRRDDGVLNNEDRMDCPNVIYGNAIAYGLGAFFGWYYWMTSLIPIPAMAMLGGLISLWLRSYELTVTDKRVYGKVQFGKRVDLPVDSVSATAMLGSRGVAVSTPSGKICFRAIKNANEIYDVINNLLIVRQQNKETFVTRTEMKIDEIEQLTQYKELFDKGVITQEEFDAKKKQLLGL